MPRILVILDDHARLREMAQSLEQSGFRVESVLDAVDDIADLKQRQRGEVAQRLQAEEALRVSMQRHLSLVVAASQIVWTTDASGEVVDAPPTWMAFTGQTREDILGWGWLEALHPDDRERTVRVWTEAVAARIRCDTEYRLRRKDGVYRHMAVRGVPLCDNQDWTKNYWEDPILSASGACLVPAPNCIREWVGVCTDITEQKTVEEDLGRERDLLHALMDNVPDAIYFKDIRSRFIRVNRSLAARFGLSEPSMAAGKNDFDFFTEDHARQAFFDEQDVIRTGRPIVAREEEESWPDGRTTWASSTKMPLRDRDGQIIGTFGISRDITRNKQAEDALRVAEERARLLLESSAEGIYGIDRRGLCTFINKAAAEMLGYKPEEVLGRNVHYLIHHTHPDGSPYPVEECPIFLAFRKGDGCRVDHELLWRSDGTSFPVEYSSSPLRIEGQRARGAVVTFTDITARKRVEEERRQAKEAAEAANRAKSEFLANMSHEIRTPMNAIIGMTELLADTELTPEQHEYQEMVRKSADSLLGLINDILDFSKIEAGKLDLDQTEFALRDALGDTLSTLSLRAYQKGLELACDIAPDVPDGLVGDPGRLRQVVVNLVGNALKFTEKGEVLVSVVCCPPSAAEDSLRTVATDGPTRAVQLQFSVSDTGIGIPLDKRDLIFGAFNQADSSTTRRYGGTGLGLTISTRLVELMGGRVWVESNFGKGSTFHFTVWFGMHEHPSSPRIPKEMALVRGLTVLIVDDNETNRRILEETLSQWEMKPETVDGGPAALDALDCARRANRPYALVLLDAQMPWMDGFTLAGLIRNRPDTAGTKVLMLTSGGQPGDAARCRQLGIAAYLTKPIKQADLWRVILRVLDGDNGAELADRPARQPAPARPLRILLAEDNPMNQTLAVRLLEKQGHTVVVTSNGRKALEALGFTGTVAPPQHSFDLILMDVQMPEMDGLEAAAAIRVCEKKSGGHVPIIAMTAYAMKGDRELCLSSGMDGYLAKPIRPDELYAAIGSLPARIATPAPFDGSAILKPFLNWDVALEHVGGDPELLRELVAVFLIECPRWMVALRDGLAHGNVKQVNAAAHPLKGSLGTFAANAAQTFAVQLEKMAREGSLAGGMEVLASLEQELARLLPALDAFSKNGKL